jgi:transcriptional regulator with XRE-family HTH domain
MLDQAQPRPLQQVLAANLRRLRIARHLSLSELARATGMSKATVSGIEHGRSNPTVETLASLAAALRIGVGELLEELPPGEIRIARASQSPPRSKDGFWRLALDELSSGDPLAIAEIALGPRQTHEPEPRLTGSRAHLYVLQGKLVAGPVERVTELATGDYASFPIDVPHSYEAPRHGARALLLEQVPG